MLTLIGDLVINEYSQDEYTIRVTTFRRTGELASIVVDSNFFGEEFSQVFYGSIAKDLLRVLTSAKLGQSLGLMEKLNLDEFNFKGMCYAISKENN